MTRRQPAGSWLLIGLVALLTGCRSYDCRGDDHTQTVFVARYESDGGWWGEFHIFGVDARGRVAWTAEIDEPPTEQSIALTELRHPAGHHSALIHVEGITHQGNGNLYVYRMEGHKAVEVLRVKVRDSNPDPDRFAQDRHQPRYQDVNGDGISDLRIQGSILTEDEKGEEVVAARSVDLVYVWDPTGQRFRPPPSPARAAGTGSAPLGTIQ